MVPPGIRSATSRVSVISPVNFNHQAPPHGQEVYDAEAQQRRLPTKHRPKLTAAQHLPQRAL